MRLDSSMRRLCSQHQKYHCCHCSFQHYAPFYVCVHAQVCVCVCLHSTMQQVLCMTHCDVSLQVIAGLRSRLHEESSRADAAEASLAESQARQQALALHQLTCNLPTAASGSTHQVGLFLATASHLFWAYC